MLRILKASSMTSVLVAAGIQFLPSPVERHLAPAGRFNERIGPEVGAIIQRSCKDCHSNGTTWPWYSRVAPISWLVATDVRKGREKLDFSTWSSRTPSANEVEEICDAVTNGSMPLRGYRLLHREAKLSKHDVDVICAWADGAMTQARGTPTEVPLVAPAAAGFGGGTSTK